MKFTAFWPSARRARRNAMAHSGSDAAQIHVMYVRVHFIHEIIALIPLCARHILIVFRMGFTRSHISLNSFTMYRVRWLLCVRVWQTVQIARMRNYNDAPFRLSLSLSFSLCDHVTSLGKRSGLLSSEPAKSKHNDVYVPHDMPWSLSP